LQLAGLPVLRPRRSASIRWAEVPWVKSGQVKAQETVVEGLERTPEAFLGLFSGQNTGKMLVKL
jgi:NADPH-dependent curcumin reductase CurA